MPPEAKMCVFWCVYNPDGKGALKDRLKALCVALTKGA